MASQLREEAEALAIALELGVVAVASAVAWADAYIAEQPRPHASLCEVATAGRRYPQDVAALLREIPGQADAAAVHGLLLQLLQHGFTQENAYAVACRLYDLAVNQRIDDATVRDLAWWAWDALDLAEARTIQETRAEIIAQMKVALDRAATAAASRGPRWLRFPAIQ